MRIALVGAHRTGKTTLATSLSNRLDIPFVASSASSVAKEMGVNLKAEISLGQRIDFQQRVLAGMDKTYSAAGDKFITDRSPLDAAAYLLADATNVAGSVEERAGIAAYVEDAMRMTQRLFDVVVLVQPGIEYIDEPGKPPFNEAYQEHIHMLINGMVCDSEMDYRTLIIPRKLYDIRERTDGLIEALRTMSVNVAVENYIRAA